MNSKLPELLPCPFCGSTNVQLLCREQAYYRYSCMDFECSTVWSGAIALAKSQWNTRASTTERDKAIARAAFIQARQRQWQADDYLNSPEFLELVK